jgi:cobalt-zinc-cadmium efflux system membrane fusion protein
MRRKGMREKTKIVVPLVLIWVFLGFLVLGLGGCAKSPEEAMRDERGEHDEHEERMVVLSEAEMKEFGVEIGSAEPGMLKVHVGLPGEVVSNPDRLAHLAPRVSGIVREVRKNLGDQVRTGEVMAVLESRELADVKSGYLAAKERLALAQANFRREEDLWKQKVSAEQEYLEAKQTLAEARIELNSAEQKLHALGFSEAYLTDLPSHPDVSYTRYRIVAPFEGTVIAKHITLGEKLENDAEAFVIADLSSVWVNLSVYQKDLPFVSVGQPVTISPKEGSLETSGTISYMSPLIDEKTRTAAARVVLANPDGHWRPGLFVSGRVTVDAVEVPILAPQSALQQVDGSTCIFAETEEGFEPKPVKTGRANNTHIEILSGLEPGKRYVTSGAFTLKSELGKEAFGDGDDH